MKDVIKSWLLALLCVAIYIIMAMEIMGIDLL